MHLRDCIFPDRSGAGDDKPAGNQNRILTIDKARFTGVPSQAGPGNDINAWSTGFQKAPTRAPPAWLLFGL